MSETMHTALLTKKSNNVGLSNLYYLCTSIYLFACAVNVI